MLTFVLAIVIVMLLIAGMAIGVIMGRKPLAGSCGGVGAALGEKDYTCDLCGGDPNKCESLQEESDDNNLAYDAASKTGTK
ncbi:(Na+)-NQR maturation NqrM [Porticoccaceae bacterium LTM1]|nr:(Na+)-NQR maturation NqrM [Porticoccaceae bacterium LTM1]